MVTKEKLLPVTTGNNDIHARRARRMLEIPDKDIQFPGSYHYYPVKAWQPGKELLLIGMGGESVVNTGTRHGDGQEMWRIVSPKAYTG